MLVYNSSVSGNCYKVRLPCAQLPSTCTTSDVVDRSNRLEVLDT